MEWYCYLRNIQDLFADGKTPYERRCGVAFHGPVLPFGSMVEYHPISAKGPVATASIRPNSLARFFIPWICVARGRIWKGDILVADIRNWNRWTHRKCLAPMSGEKFIFPVADGTVNISGEDQELRTPTFDTGTPNSRRKSRKFSWRIRRVFSATSRLTSGCR